MIAAALSAVGGCKVRMAKPAPRAATVHIRMPSAVIERLPRGMRFGDFVKGIMFHCVVSMNNARAALHGASQRVIVLAYT